ncbi:MAG: tyrosine-type recombinase/integrase [Ilumatobacter sp.]|nr:tyrosine-type recombinase/integrase [Ilumatobacter sp.]
MGSRREDASISAFERELDSWVRSLRARRRSASTIAAYRSDLQLFVHRTGVPAIADVSTACVASFLDAQHAEGCAASTVERRRRSLHLFFEWCLGRGTLATNPVPERGSLAAPEPVPTLPSNELAALLGSCRAAPERTVEARATNRRDIAIVMLLMTTGARATELVGLDVDDLDLDADRLHLGVGTSERIVDLLRVPTSAVAEYVEVRDSMPRYSSTPALFLGARGRLTASGLRQMLERRCDAAGVRHLRPHEFRRTVAADAARRGMDDLAISEMLGWRTTRMAHLYTASAAE